MNVHGPDAYTPLLKRIQAMVERVAFMPTDFATQSGGFENEGGEDERNGAETFNHVMLNRYADGGEYIGKHKDNKENKVTNIPYLWFFSMVVEHRPI